MKKQAAKTSYVAKKTPRKKMVGQARSRWMVWALFVLLLFLSLPFWVPSFDKQALSRVSNWLTERKLHLQDKIKNGNLPRSKPELAQKNEMIPAVHFEFYTTLPNMQMQPSAVVPTTPRVPVGLASKALPRATLTKSPVIANVDELEREISTFIKKSHRTNLAEKKLRKDGHHHE